MKNQNNGITKNNIRAYYFLILVLIGLNFIYNFETHGVVGMNATVYAFSYSYGFMSRGLMGTILNAICSIFGDKFYCNSTLVMLSMLAWILLIVVFILLISVVVRKSNYDYRVMAFALCFIPMVCNMFLPPANFGRTDIFMLIISIVACLIVYFDRAVFLCIPLAALGMMVHQGYIFMFFNIVVAILICRLMNIDGKSKHTRKYYISILVLTCICVAGLFIWFEILSHKVLDFSISEYNEIYSKAEQLSTGGTVTMDTVIRHEVLGEETMSLEYEAIVKNAIELIILAVLSLPVLRQAYLLVKDILKETKQKKLCMVLLCGSLSMLPEYILKCDYGRWVFATVTYFVMLSLFLMAFNAKVFVDAYRRLYDRLAASWLGMYVVLYFMVLLPFGSVSATRVGERIIKYLFIFIDKIF